jgi:hypothetical protein
MALAVTVQNFRRGHRAVLYFDLPRGLREIICRNDEHERDQLLRFDLRLMSGERSLLRVVGDQAFDGSR